MSLGHTIVKRCAGRRMYTLREAVAFAEAQGVLSPSAPSLSSVAVPTGLGEAPFLGCDPLRGAFHDILSDPVRAANVGSARPSSRLQPPSSVRIEGTVRSVKRVTVRPHVVSGTAAADNDSAATPYDVCLVVDVPGQTPSATGSSADTEPSGPFSVEVRGRTSSLAATEDHPDDEDAVEFLVTTLKEALEGKRVMVSGTLRLDAAAGCLVDVGSDDLLSALIILGQ